MIFREGRMKTSITRRTAMILTSLGTGFAVFSSVPGRVDEGEADYLFVPNAHGVEFDRSVITLKGVGANTVFFTDRPERLTGHIPTGEFLELWDQGDDSFAGDPQNAALSVLEGDGVVNVVAELTEPSLKGNDLSNRVAVLDGELPTNAGASALFVDSYARRVARRTARRTARRYDRKARLAWPH
jgi:hypothetical protein